MSNIWIWVMSYVHLAGQPARWSLILILPHPVNIQRREPYSYDFIKKKILLWLVFKHLLMSLFQTCYDDRDH